MAEFPALPLWTDAYLGDTLHLSLEEHGAYLKMLMIAWRSSGCRIADDDKRIAKMLGISTTRWRDKIRPIIEPLWTVSGGYWTQSRLSKEREFCSNYSAKQRERANHRWSAKSLIRLETGDAVADAVAMHPYPYNKDSDSHPSGKSLDRRARRSKRRVNVSPESIREFEATFWPAYPLKVARPYALEKFDVARRSASLEQIMGGLETYKQTKPPDRDWLHASTFLHQERFNDVPELPLKSNGTNHVRQPANQRPSVVDAVRRFEQRLKDRQGFDDDAFGGQGREH